jgi:post-GPI attachment to proteins factor 3
MDYFSAWGAIMYGLFYTVVRLYHLYIKPRAFTHGSSSRHRLLVPWGALCSTLFFGHLTYLTLLPRFDYDWNMKANIAVGFLHNFLWMAYALVSPPFQRFRSLPNSYRPTYVLKPALISVTIILVSGLEIFDFSPWWRIIDAHSLWHLATVPIVIAWYRFLIDDSLDGAWKQGIL